MMENIILTEDKTAQFLAEKIAKEVYNTGIGALGYYQMTKKIKKILLLYPNMLVHDPRYSKL